MARNTEQLENVNQLVRMTVPADPQNPLDTEVRVGINGHFWTIKRGAEVEVPRAVYDLLLEAGKNPSVSL